MHTASTHKVDPIHLEHRLLEESNGRSFFALYTSRGYKDAHTSYALLFAWGAQRVFGAEEMAAGALEGGWRFGYAGYEMRHQFESLNRGNPALGDWPEALFFEPEVVGTLSWDGVLSVTDFTSDRSDQIIQDLIQPSTPPEGPTALDFKPMESKEEYLSAVEDLKAHIQRGDIYEVNYCTAFKAEVGELHSSALFEKMASRTEAPFSAYLKLDQYELLCTSPERYFSKKGQRVLTQPIKGTNRRLAQNEGALTSLRESEKERAENVMIVDLVRNDLSRVATKGSVQVSELYGTYAFKNVNQLISTVEANISPNTGFWELFGATFPMGSMTGAPKVSAMQLAERYEKTAREIYSGTIGYTTPEGDADFNVVIRSVAINRTTGVATTHVGGAITILSDPQQEYEECLLKAESMFDSAR